VNYTEFLHNKRISHKPNGFAPRKLPSGLFPWQAKIVERACLAGRYAIFAGTGLGKTAMQLAWADQVVRHTNGRVLILTPLAVAKQTVREGEKFGIEVTHCRDRLDVQKGVNVANYEMLHHFDCSKFNGVVLDESSILKSFMGKTRIAITRAFESTPYRLACTATPSPNDQLEIGNHCHFLGVMTGSEMIMRFFVNDTMKAGGYRIKGHAENEFWRWMSTWAVGLTRPDDLGYPDPRFVLPKLNVTEHRVRSEQLACGSQLFATDAPSATELHRQRKLTTADRAVAVAMATPDDNSIVWVNTDYEADAIREALPTAVEIHGRMPAEKKEELLDAFSLGQFKHLLTKPSICGFGMNWQHCSDMSFAGMSYSFEDLFQAIRRCWRFGQTKPVNVRLFLTDSDDHVASTVQRKAVSHEAMVTKLSAACRATWGEEECQQLQLRKYAPARNLKLPAWLQSA
jgi:hypothetical protein